MLKGSYLNFNEQKYTLKPAKFPEAPLTTSPQNITKNITIKMGGQNNQKIKVQNLLLSVSTHYFKVKMLNVKVFVDGKEIPLNEFVVKILGGTIVGAVTSLKGVKGDWKEIEIKVTQ